MVMRTDDEMMNRNVGKSQPLPSLLINGHHHRLAPSQPPTPPRATPCWVCGRRLFRGVANGVSAGPLRRSGHPTHPVGRQHIGGVDLHLLLLGRRLRHHLIPVIAKGLALEAGDLSFRALEALPIRHDVVLEVLDLGQSEQGVFVS
jgi:hypothetical protein